MKLWRIRQLAIEGKILIFEYLAIPKVVHVALVKDVSSSTIAQLGKIQKQIQNQQKQKTKKKHKKQNKNVNTKFIWKNGKPKLKHATLCNEYEQEGLKNVDIFSKITILE